MSETSKPAAPVSPATLAALGVDPATGGASVLVVGRIRAQKDGASVNAFTMPANKGFPEKHFASVDVSYFGGTTSVSIEPNSDTSRLLAAKPANTPVTFAVPVEDFEQMYNSRNGEKTIKGYKTTSFGQLVSVG